MHFFFSEELFGKAGRRFEQMKPFKYVFIADKRDETESNQAIAL